MKRSTTPTLPPSPQEAQSKRCKPSTTMTTPRPRDYFAELPVELLEKIYCHAPAIDWHRLEDGRRRWDRQLCLMQLSSRWFWVVMRLRYRTIKVELDNVLPLLGAMRDLPRLAELVQVFKVYFDRIPRDIMSDFLWDPRYLTAPLKRPIPPPRERVFIDRRRIYRLMFPSWSGCLPEQPESCQHRCPLCKARGRPGWPFQSASYDDDVLSIAIRVSDILVEKEDAFLLTDGPAGKGPIEGLAEWDDWFAAFVELASLCRPQALVWNNPLTSISEEAVKKLAELNCIRALFIGEEDYPELHYRPLVEGIELLRIQSGADFEAKRRKFVDDNLDPSTSDLFSRNSETWALQILNDDPSTPHHPTDLIDDAPEGSYGHVLFTLLSSVDSSRLKALRVGDSHPSCVPIYKSPGLLPLLLAVPDLEDPKYVHPDFREGIDAVRALRLALSGTQLPLTTADLLRIATSLPACEPILVPVQQAADEICRRLNGRPMPAGGSMPPDIIAFLTRDLFDDDCDCDDDDEDEDEDDDA